MAAASSAVATAQAAAAGLPIGAASFLFSDDPLGTGVSPYLLQRKKHQSAAAWDALVGDLAVSTTLYVGNLSFFTTEEQIVEVFRRCGPLKRVIMGLNKVDKTPCGFCFVEYHKRADALAAVNLLSGSKLDDRVIRADLDPGFTDGRQYGRSKTGGQVRDDHRDTYDSGRGGWGTRTAQAMGLPPSRASAAGAAHMAGGGAGLHGGYATTLVGPGGVATTVPANHPIARYPPPMGAPPPAMPPGLPQKQMAAAAAAPLTAGALHAAAKGGAAPAAAAAGKPAAAAAAASN